MNYAASWQLIVDQSVYKNLRAIPKRDVTRILAAIAQMAGNPYSGDIVRMQGEQDAWRRRVGSYRIFYDVIQDERTVHVYSVERRSSTTY